MCTSSRSSCRRDCTRSVRRPHASDVKPEIELPAGPRGLAAAGTAGRSNQVVMDLFLDRERLQRFDLSKGPSTLSRMVIRGPFNITDRGNTASRTKVFICRPTNAGRGGALCASDSDEPRASRVPPTSDEGGHRPSLRVLPDRTHRCRFRHRYRSGAPRHARRPRLLVQDRAGSGRRSGLGRCTARATWIWRLACRSFCGAAFPTRSCSAWPNKAS